MPAIPEENGDSLAPFLLVPWPEQNQNESSALGMQRLRQVKKLTGTLLRFDCRQAVGTL